MQQLQPIVLQVELVDEIQQTDELVERLLQLQHVEHITINFSIFENFLLFFHHHHDGFIMLLNIEHFHQHEAVELAQEMV